MKTTIPHYTAAIVFAIIGALAIFFQTSPAGYYIPALMAVVFVAWAFSNERDKARQHAEAGWAMAGAWSETVEQLRDRIKAMHLATPEGDAVVDVDKVLANVVVTDLETSGLHPRRHGVLSIGAVKMATGETFCAETRLDEDRTYEEAALAVNGRAQETLRSLQYQDARAARQQYLDWLGVSPTGGRWLMAGENVGKHDYWFFREIRTSPSQPDMDGAILHRSVDLHTMALACTLAGIFTMPEKGWSADRVFEACGLGVEPKPHGPLTGALMSAEALRFMARKLAGCAQGLTAKQPSSQGEPYRVPTSLDGLPNTLFGVGNFPEGSTLMESGIHTPRTGEPKADTLANFQAPDHKLV